MISCYIKCEHKNRDVILPFVTFTYHTAVQSSAGFSPFFLVYGRHPPSVLYSSFFSCPLSTTDNAPDHFVSGLANWRNLAQLRTESCQNDQKSRYDGAHRDVSFETTDEVLLSTPLRAPGLCKKFMPLFIGANKVLQRISPVHYCSSYLSLTPGDAE